MLAIATLSLYALGRGRRTLVVALLLLVPPALGIAYVAGDPQPDGMRFAVQLFDQLVLPVLMPITALIIASSALGGEIEDRTLIYLLLRPIARTRIVLAKWGAATLLTIVLVEVSLLVTYLITASRTAGAPVGTPSGTPLQALLVAGAAGSLAYCGLFLAVGVLAPRRGLIVGIIYILAWEGLAAGLSTALATFSIRRYAQAVLDGMLGSERLATIRPIDISVGAGLLVLALVTLAGIAATIVLLRRIELP